MARPVLIQPLRHGWKSWRRFMLLIQVLLHPGFKIPMLLHRHNAETNVHRFYSMCLGRDLFGDWLFYREWGRISSPGRVKVDRYETEAAAQTAFVKLLKKKQRKGYTAVPVVGEYSYDALPKDVFE
jgi:predicted DNA-binding WGR domain protein